MIFIILIPEMQTDLCATDISNESANKKIINPAAIPFCGISQRRSKGL
jgi:hypothetical protein